MKKLALILTALVLTLCVSMSFVACNDLPIDVPEDYVPETNFDTDNGLVFNLMYDDTYSVGRGPGTLSKELVIPAAYNGKPVTMIADQAFCTCDELTSVVIPTSVTKIGGAAFALCTNLTSVTIPENVTEIGYGAFTGCSELTSITIPEKVTEILPWTFRGCFKLTEVNNKTNVDVSVGSTENGYLGYYAKTVSTNGETSEISNENGYLLYRDGSDVTLVGYLGTETELTLPASVTEIKSFAFHGFDEITSVTIPSTVKKIGYAAFTGCSSLTSITIPASVTEIEDSAFSGCYRLYEVTDLSALEIAKGSTENGAVGYYAKDVYTGDHESKLVKEGDYLFYRSAEENALVSYFGGNASVTLPAGAYELSPYAFYNQSTLKTVVIPQGVTSIGKGAFFGCDNLTSVTIGDDVTEIGYRAFKDCSRLSAVLFGEQSQLKSIALQAFYNCGALTSFTLPASLESIAYNAFDSCGCLVEIYNKSETEDITESLPYQIKNIYTEEGGSKLSERDGYILYTEGESLILIRYAGSATELSIPNGVTEINESAFNGRGDLTSVTFPDSLQVIGDYAFSDCVSLTSITIPDSVTTIGFGAFSGCANVTAITLGKGVIDVDSSSFSGGPIFLNFQYRNGTYLGDAENPHRVLLYVNPYAGTDFEIHPDTEVVAGSAISSDMNLTSITIPANVKHIGRTLFAYSKLTSVTFEEGSKLESIGSSAFDGCENLVSIAFPATLKQIGNSAFDGCDALTSVTFGANSQLTTIGNSAFSHCVNLRAITIPEGVTSIGDNAFVDCFSLAEVCNKSSLTIEKGSEENGCLGYFAKAIYTDDYVSKLSEREDCLLYTDGEKVILVKYNGTATEVTLPNGITEIGAYAFHECTALTSVVIPDSVTRIEYPAFYGCNELRSLTIGRGVTEIEADDYSTWQSYYPKLVEIYNKSSLSITAGSKDYNYLAYCAKNVYTEESGSKLSVEEDLVLYRDGNSVSVIAYNGSAKTLTLPAGITEIHQYAFAGCKTLTSIILPEGLTNIGKYAFYNCSSLCSVTLPESLTTIGKNAFEDCDLTKYGNAYYIGNEENPHTVLVEVDPFISGVYLVGSNPDPNAEKIVTVYADTKFVLEGALSVFTARNYIIKYEGTIAEWNALIGATEETQEEEADAALAEGESVIAGDLYYPDSVIRADTGNTSTDTYTYAHDIDIEIGSVIEPAEPIFIEPIFIEPIDFVLHEDIPVICTDGETTYRVYYNYFVSEPSYYYSINSTLRFYPDSDLDYYSYLVEVLYQNYVTEVYEL